MKVVLFANARDESHIKEWVAHHLLIGFDNIIIFDHKSMIPLEKEFANFDKRVKIINCGKLEGNIKIQLMNIAKDIALTLKATWMIYLDIDEYIIINNGDNNKGIKLFLNNFNGIDQLAINWLMYGTSGLIKTLDISKGELILDNYTRSDELLCNHVKSFVKPEEIISATNPHYYNIKNPNKNFGIDGKIFNPPFHNVSIPFYKSPIYISHYVYQSENTYIKRKLNIPRDDSGTYRTDDNIKHIHQLYNERDNLLAKKKYSKQVYDFLVYKGVIKN